MHRLKRWRTRPHSPGPQPGTLGTASRANDAVDVRAMVTSCRRVRRTDAAVSLSLVLPTLNGERTRSCGLAEHALHPGAVAARLKSKQRPRVARAQEAARVGRWWPWIDSNGVTLFVQQYDRGTSCELLLALYTWYRYLVRVWSRYNTKEVKCLFCVEPRRIFYTRTRKLKSEVTIRRGKQGPLLNLKKSCVKKT